MDHLYFETLIFLVLGCFALYLEKKFPADKYHFSLGRRDFLHDIGFRVVLQLLEPIIQRILTFILGFIFVLILKNLLNISWEYYHFENKVVHFIIILLVSDFLIYWLHRYVHSSIWWQSHKLHHSPEKLDWLSSERADWIEVLIFDFATQITSLFLAGDPSFYFYFAIINPTFDFLKHANITINLGFLNKIIGNPYEHRWHHSKSWMYKKGQNFGYRFLIWDRIFGTFYLPEDLRLPESYGFIGDEHFPRSFFPRLAYSAKKISFYFYRRLRQRFTSFNK